MAKSTEQQMVGKMEKPADEPRVNYRGVKAMPFVLGNEIFEKLGSTGTASNFLVYLTSVFHMKTITATNLVNIFNGTTNIATLVAAFLSDSYFGRYKILAIASVASFLGLLGIALTAAISKLHPAQCGIEDNGTCAAPTPWQMAFLMSALGLLVIGGGGIRPCSLPFGADQFNPETESGRKGISTFFNWYYFTFTFASMLSLTIIVYVQSDISWAWGLAIPAILMFLSCVLFFMGSRIYVKTKPHGSPLTSFVQVIVAAIKNRKLELPEQQPWLSLFNHIPLFSINSRLPYTDQFRFLNKAAIITPEDKIQPDGSTATPWRLCSIQQIEEVKCLLRLLPIWASSLLYTVALIQQQNYVVFQALQSNRCLGNIKIPAATYTIFDLLGVTIWIPIYDRIIVPWLTKFTKREGGITILQKMGTGIALAIVTTLISGIVENRRRALAITNPIGLDSTNRAISSLSALWLVPQLTLTGISEAFTVIAQVELYYKQFPENMRSIGGSILYVGLAVSSYLSGFLTSIIHQISKKSATGDWLPDDLNKGRLDLLYYLVAVLGVMNLGYFIVCARWYKYKGNGDLQLEVGVEKTQLEKQLV